MNRDIDDRLLPEGEYRDAINVNVGESEGGDIGAVENLKGNSLVAGQEEIYGETIGVIKDENTDKIYWMTTWDDPNGIDAIHEYDVPAGTITTLVSEPKSREAELPTCKPELRESITSPDTPAYGVQGSFSNFPAQPAGYCADSGANNNGQKADGTAANTAYDYIDDSVCTYPPPPPPDPDPPTESCTPGSLGDWECSFWNSAWADFTFTETGGVFTPDYIDNTPSDVSLSNVVWTPANGPSGTSFSMTADVTVNNNCFTNAGVAVPGCADLVTGTASGTAPVFEERWFCDTPGDPTGTCTSMMVSDGSGFADQSSCESDPTCFSATPPAAATTISIDAGTVFTSAAQGTGCGAGPTGRIIPTFNFSDSNHSGGNITYTLSGVHSSGITDSFASRTFSTSFSAGVTSYVPTFVPAIPFIAHCAVTPGAGTQDPYWFAGTSVDLTCTITAVSGGVDLGTPLTITQTGTI